MKRSLLIVILCGFITLLHANPVDTALAKMIVKNFVQTNISPLTQKQVADYQLVYQSVSLQKNGEQQVYYHVFNISNSGYVIVSGDDQVMPVLAYSTTTTFNVDEMSPALTQILNAYRLEIAYVIDNNVSSTQEIRAAWDQLKNGNPIQQKDVKTSVAPLLQTKWGQSGKNFGGQFYELYNNLCPYDNVKNKRCVTGCVATAMAQVLRYWEYPSRGMGSHTFVHNTYGHLSADFESVVYAYDSMPKELSNNSTAFEINMVSTLMYHCGVSVEMDYGPDESGSSLIEYYKGYRSGEHALKTHFGFPTAYSVEKDDYSNSSWVNLLKTELDAGRPILYRGSGNSGGHAFVCDGYNESNYFHFNWGWWGSNDGYFLVTALNPGSYDFSSGQSAVINVKPLSVELQPDSNNIIYVSPAGSGSKNGSSWDNATDLLAYVMMRSSNKPLKIWVKEGTYYGDSTSLTAFTLGAGNRMYGGFAGNESYDYNLTLRDLINNQSVLEGSGLQQVLYLNASDDSVTICDGFVIQNGLTTGGYDYGAGAFVCNNTQLINSIIKNNITTGQYAYGAGVYSEGGTIINCKILDNATVNSSGGGGLCLKNGTLTKVINSIFANNTGKFGAGILAWGSADFVNCNIVNNIALSNGGGFYGNGSGESCNFTNCILWGNTLNGNSNQLGVGSTTVSVNYSAVQGGYTGTSNINLEAINNNTDNGKNYVRFYNPLNNVYSLMENSVCVDAGNPDLSCLNNMNVDINLTARVKKARIDIGAYEYGCVNIHPVSDNICQGEKYQLNGFDIDAKDTGILIYSKLIGVYNDCDSVLQLTLSVLPVTSSSFTVKQPEPYTWNDSVYSTSGAYKQVFTGYNGCDSVVTLFYTNTNNIKDYNTPVQISLFPNPASDMLYIQISGMPLDEIYFRLYDMKGKLLDTQKAISETTAFNMSGLSKGMYYLYVNNNNQWIKTLKVVKQ